METEDTQQIRRSYEIGPVKKKMYRASDKMQTEQNKTKPKPIG